MASRWRSPASVVFLAILMGGAIGLATAPGASALSCVFQESGWAEIRLHDAYTDEVLARVPFTGSWNGYGCNIGNMHAVEGAWLGFMSHDDDRYFELEQGAVKPGIIHVVNLETGARGSMEAGTTKDVFAMSLAGSRPHVFLLTRGSHEDEWVVHRMIPTTRNDTMAMGGFRQDSIRLQAHHVILHGRFAALLIDHQNAQPRVVIHDLIENRHIATHEPAMPAEATPPWRLMDATPQWLVIASRAPTRDQMLPEHAKVYVHDTGKKQTHPFPQPHLQDELDFDSARHGAFRIDADRVVNEVWQATLPWSPARLQVRMLPSGTPLDLEHGGLMRDVAVDGGRIVKGSYLQEEPAEKDAWLSEDAAEPRFKTLDTAVMPGPAVAALVVALALLVGMRRGKRGP